MRTRKIFESSEVGEKRLVFGFRVSELAIERRKFFIVSERTLLNDDGGGVTRTHEVRRRGIYSPLQLPLCDTPAGFKKTAGKRT